MPTIPKHSKMSWEYHALPKKDKPKLFNYKLRIWRNASDQFKKDNPLCAHCLIKGIPTPSYATDHIKPIPHHDPWDRSNWQALCRKCHSIKTKMDINMGRGV